MCEDITIIVVTRTIKLPIKNISRDSTRNPPLCNNNYQVLMLQVTTSDGNQSYELYNLIKQEVTTLLTNDHISSSYSIYECYTIIPPWMWVQGLPYALGSSPRVPELHQVINNHANHKWPQNGSFGPFGVPKAYLSCQGDSWASLTTWTTQEDLQESRYLLWGW